MLYLENISLRLFLSSSAEKNVRLKWIDKILSSPGSRGASEGMPDQKLLKPQDSVK